MTEFLLGAFFVAAGLAWAEFREWMPWLARKIVERAVSVLDTEVRQRMQEELTAEVAAIPGKLSPLIFACSIWWGFWRGAVIAKLESNFSRYAVRLVDVAISGSMLLACVPMILAMLLGTWISCGRFGLRKSSCAGQNGVLFEISRFHVHDAVSGQMTRFGRLVNQLGLDTLPFLFNVLRGEMSLVGPPPPPFGKPMPRERSRHKPGLVWNRRCRDVSIDGFGVSTAATLKVYFRLLWAAIRAALRA